VAIVFAKPELKWKGFEPKPYFLDVERVRKLGLQDTATKREMTIGDVMDAFKGQKVTITDQILDVVIESQSRRMVVKGPEFHQRILMLLYRFFEEEVLPFQINWFYYDSDENTSDPHNRYTFFLVWKGKIIDERTSLYDSIQNGFDPCVLETGDDLDGTWGNERAESEAYNAFWYRRFYAETDAGQLMAMRPDKPKLYYFSAPASLSEIHASLRQVKVAIWIIAAITIINLYLRLK